MSTLKYGPHTVEIEAILEKFKDPKNSDVFMALNVDESEASDVADRPARIAAWVATWGVTNTWDHNTAESSGWYEVWGVTVARGMCWTVTKAFCAITIRDFIGEDFTQAHYDVLIAPLNNFFYIVDNTEPDSPLRKLVCDLVSKGMEAAEALESAKRALLL